MPSQTTHSEYWAAIERIGGRRLQPHYRRSLIKEFGWRILDDARVRFASYLAGEQGGYLAFRQLCEELQRSSGAYQADFADHNRPVPAKPSPHQPVDTPVDWPDLPDYDDLREYPAIIRQLATLRMAGTQISLDFAVAGALATWAAATGNRLAFEAYGFGYHFCNLYIVLVGATGRSYKSSVLKYTKQLVEATNPQLLAADESSAEALVRDLADFPSRLWIKDELSGLLSSLRGRDYMGPIREILLSLFDHSGVYRRHLMKATYEASDPCLSFLAGIQPEIMGEELFSGRNVTSGLINRLILVHSKGEEERRPRLENQVACWTTVTTRLRAIQALPRVTVDCHDIAPASSVLVDTGTYAPHDYIAQRSGIIALKIATLLAAADRWPTPSSPVPSHWLSLALGLLDRWYRSAATIIDAVYVKQPDEKERRDIMSLICEASHNGRRPLTMAEIQAATHMSKRNAESYRNDLHARGWAITTDDDELICMRLAPQCPERRATS